MAWKKKQGVICGLLSTKDKVWPKKAGMLWRMWGIYDGSSSHCKKCLPKTSLHQPSLSFSEKKERGLDPSTDLYLSLFLIQKQKGQGEFMLREGRNWWTLWSRWKCSHAIHFLTFSSFKVIFFLSDSSLQSRCVWFEHEVMPTASDPWGLGS